MRVVHGHGRAGVASTGCRFHPGRFRPRPEFFGGLALEEFLIGIHLFKPFACAAHAIFIAALRLVRQTETSSLAVLAVTSTGAVSLVSRLFQFIDVADDP